METRATLRPGQKGTRKLVERFGERLVRVRYVYDAAAGRRYKTVELIVAGAAWRPRPRNQRRCDDDVVHVRIAYGERDLRERAKRLGALWRPAQKLWEITWRDAKRLEISHRVVNPETR
ncbi:MAG: hypothetical protein WAO95_12885 [Burkholderiales bacterium]